MDFLQQILENSPFAFVSAIVLGLMTSISPCPLATNIAALGFITRDITYPQRVFYHGLFYTLGRAFSYVTLAIALYFLGNKLNISWFFQNWGEKIIGPLLILIGFFMIDLITLKFSALIKISDKLGENHHGRFRNSFLLGILFALAFCPYSAVLFFVMLIPMSITSPSGLFLPFIYAVGTGIPVLLFAWIIAFSVEHTAVIFKNLKKFELYVRHIIGILFIIIGLYYVLIIYINPHLIRN